MKCIFLNIDVPVMLLCKPAWVSALDGATAKQTVRGGGKQFFNDRANVCRFLLSGFSYTHIVEDSVKPNVFLAVSGGDGLHFHLCCSQSPGNNESVLDASFL